jgi:hypothetical protein
MCVQQRTIMPGNGRAGKGGATGQPGSGSQLYHTNSWAMIWPPDYPAAARWINKRLDFKWLQFHVSAEYCISVTISMRQCQPKWLKTVGDIHAYMSRCNVDTNNTYRYSAYIHFLYVIHTQYMQCKSACIGNNQIRWFLYHVHIRLYPSQRMHILNNDTYMIHTRSIQDTYRYIRYILIWTVTSDLYLTCILTCIFVSCMYLVHMCMYCMYLYILFATKYNMYRYRKICTIYIHICTRYNTDTYTIRADTYTFTL